MAKPYLCLFSNLIASPLPSYHCHLIIKLNEFFKELLISARNLNRLDLTKPITNWRAIYSNHCQRHVNRAPPYPLRPLPSPPSRHRNLPRLPTLRSRRCSQIWAILSRPYTPSSRPRKRWTRATRSVAWLNWTTVNSTWMRTRFWWPRTEMYVR